MPTWIADAPAAFVAPTSGCRWPVISTCDVEIADDDQEALALFGWATQAAIDVLWAASGRRYGICSRTIRPCLPDCDPGWINTGWDYVGQRLPGAPLDWRLAACGKCGHRACSCSAVHEVELWNRDVRGVIEVRIDGELLDRTLYHRAGRFLVRHAGDMVNADLAAGVEPGGGVVELGDITLTGEASVDGDMWALNSGVAAELDVSSIDSNVIVTFDLNGMAVTVSPVPTSIVGASIDETGMFVDVTGNVEAVWPAGTTTISITSIPVSPETPYAITAIRYVDSTLDNPGWPRCQDRNVQAGDVGSWTVEYMWGRRVPAMGRLAAGVLQCEFYKALVPDAGECGLPVHIASRVIEGQTINFLDPLTVLNQGIVGIGGVVDQFITRSNPNMLQREARAFRADDPRRIRGRR